MYVSWCAEKSGNGKVIPKTASCGVGVQWFKQRGRFYLRNGYTPVSGDIVYFSTKQYPNGGGHVGIVEKVSGGRVYTIEGNTSGGSGVIANGGGVAKKSYALGYTNIYGYGHPDYETEDDEVVTKADVMIDGKVYSCDVIEKDNVNYVKLRSLTQAGYDVVFDSGRNIPAITAPQCRSGIPDCTVDQQAAVDKLMRVCGLEKQTIDFLRKYKYGDALITKISEKLMPE